MSPEVDDPLSRAWLHAGVCGAGKGVGSGASSSPWRAGGLWEWFRAEGLVNFILGVPGGFCLSGLKSDHLGEGCSASRERANLARN